MGYKIDRPELTFWEKIYITEVIKGMGVSTRHFLRNLFGRKDTVTVQYPEQQPTYPKRTRGHHRLMFRDDGTARCVACMLCSTACPANCITIKAGDYGDDQIEKYPISFDIDLLVCVYCGMCEEACPCDAIRMDSGIHTPPEATRPAGRVGKVDLMKLGSPSTAKQGGIYKG
jgi:NADH-quinone oxidoreductase subunit I